MKKGGKSIHIVWYYAIEVVARSGGKGHFPLITFCDADETVHSGENRWFPFVQDMWGLCICIQEKLKAVGYL